MALLRLLAPAAAVLLCACSVSALNDGGDDKLKANAALQQPAPEKSKEAPNSEMLKTVAINLAAVSDPASKAYKIGPLDVLEVTVFKVPDLSKTFQVSETGTISFPLIGEIQAGGRTAREVEHALSKRLGEKYLQNPQVAVLVKEHNSQRVTVDGAVRKPGVVPIKGGLTLLQAIAEAQGTNELAEATAVVLRKVDGKRLVAKYDLSEIRSGQSVDPLLEANDVVIVPTSDVKEGINYVIKFVPLATLVPLL